MKRTGVRRRSVSHAGVRPALVLSGRSNQRSQREIVYGSNAKIELLRRWPESRVCMGGGLSMEISQWFLI